MFWFVALLACAPKVVPVSFVDDVVVVPSTIPLPGRYTVGEWVSVRDCSGELDEQASIARLFAEARGDHQALVDVVLEKRVSYEAQFMYGKRMDTPRVTCWTLTARPVVLP